MQEMRRSAVTLVLGGARSGKSRYAQQLGERAGTVVFVATARAGEYVGEPDGHCSNDPEMREKIARHQAERPPAWSTVEEPLHLGAAIEQHGPGAELLLIDCLTFFAANLLETGSPVEIARQLDHLCRALAASPCAVVLVSNEVGSGVVPAYPSGRRYRDLLGELNQRVANLADEVVLMVAGLPLALKSSSSANAETESRKEGGRIRKTLLLLTALLCLTGNALASRTLTDELGRTVVVPDHPHRVICLAPSITDAVFSLGAGADVAAISDYTKYPAEALKKPSVGNTLDPSIETILSLHPDLVLGIQTTGQSASAQQLTRLGIPVFLVNPDGLTGVLRSVTSLGHALNRDAQAAALVYSLQQRIDAVRARVRGKPEPTVFMPIWYDPIITIGRHAFITEIIEAAGGRSITADLPADWPQIGMETVVARAPQALLLVRGGKITFAVLGNRPGWSSLPAVRARRAYYVDERIELPSPVAIDALEDLARQFHP